MTAAVLVLVFLIWTVSAGAAFRDLRSNRRRIDELKARIEGSKS